MLTSLLVTYVWMNGCTDVRLQMYKGKTMHACMHACSAM